MLPKNILSLSVLEKLTTLGLTDRDLLKLTNGGSETVVADPDRKYREDEQIEYQAEVLRDIETNEIVQTKTITWTYYDEPGAPVDTITIETTDADGNVNRQVIKHYTDGRQPEEVKE